MTKRIETRRKRGGGRRPGLSLVEAVVSLVIVAVMLVAALGVVGGAARARIIQRNQCRATLLARHMLEEIMQCRYEDPDGAPLFGAEPGENRPTFDDVDDFNNWEESPPQTRNGTPLPGYAGWKRSVKVVWADPNNPNAVLFTPTGLKKITVTATSLAGNPVTLTGLRAASSPYEKKLKTAATFVSWAGMTIQVGPDANAKTSSSVHLMNQVP